VNYNGWTGKENPNGYTTEHTIHWRFEGPFVDAAVNAADVKPLVAPMKTIGDEWDDYLAYLRHTSSLVERVYQLDQQHGFDGTGTPESRQFTAERLAAGASMLRDLYVAAWVKSAEPVPEWHENAAVTMTDPANDQTFARNAIRPRSAVTPPKVEFAPTPEYSPEARKAKLQGVVVVALVVDENGNPSNIHVEKSLGMGLDEKAIQAVQRYRFHPALRDGVAVPYALKVEENFRLY
jgi:TonB family protein